MMVAGRRRGQSWRCWPARRRPCLGRHWRWYCRHRLPHHEWQVTWARGLAQGRSHPPATPGPGPHWTLALTQTPHWHLLHSLNKEKRGQPMSPQHPASANRSR
jgi:hypothetical protein